jgi:hypothetical protein
MRKMLYKPSMTLTGGGSCSITSILALSTSIPLSEIRWPSTIPSLTMK